MIHHATILFTRKIWTNSSAEYWLSSLKKVSHFDAPSKSKKDFYSIAFDFYNTGRMCIWPTASSVHHTVDAGNGNRDSETWSDTETRKISFDQLW